MSFGDAGRVYALLTIGDGLGAIAITAVVDRCGDHGHRASGSEDMGKLINRQMFDSPKALAVSAGLMIVMGLVPGMPHVAFIGLGLLAGGGLISYGRNNKGQGPGLQEAQRQQDLLLASGRWKPRSWAGTM